MKITPTTKTVTSLKIELPVSEIVDNLFKRIASVTENRDTTSWDRTKEIKLICTVITILDDCIFAKPGSANHITLTEYITTNFSHIIGHWVYSNNEENIENATSVDLVITDSVGTEHLTIKIK